MSMVPSDRRMSSNAPYMPTVAALLAIEPAHPPRFAKSTDRRMHTRLSSYHEVFSWRGRGKRFDGIDNIA